MNELASVPMTRLSRTVSGLGKERHRSRHEKARCLALHFYSPVQVSAYGSNYASVSPPTSQCLRSQSYSLQQNDNSVYIISVAHIAHESLHSGVCRTRPILYWWSRGLSFGVRKRRELAFCKHTLSGVSPNILSALHHIIACCIFY
jgi:hypothetical protein